MTRDEVVAQFPDTEFIFLDGLDDAIIGVVQRHTFAPVVLYSTARILASLRAQGMTEDEAIEYFDFNIGDLWAGETTPAFLADNLLEPPEGYG